MKITPVLPAALLLTLLAVSPVHAQTTEKIALYADRFGTDCSISNTKEETVIVYIFHVGTGTRIGREFRAPKPECWTGATWVGDSYAFEFVFGQSQGPQVAVAYTACLPLPVYIGKMVFDATGAAEPCCAYPVIPSVYEPAGILTLDCASPAHDIRILSGPAVINENASCPCAPSLAAESTTWGRVKSLYN